MTLSKELGFDPRQQGKWPIKKTLDIGSAPFSREHFKAMFDELEADFDHQMEHDQSFDQSVWIKGNGGALLDMLKTSPEDHALMENAIVKRSSATFFEIARRILKDTA